MGHGFSKYHGIGIKIGRKIIKEGQSYKIKIKFFSQIRNPIFFVKKRDKATLQPLIERHIARNTLIYSDEWRAYIGIEQLDYKHKTVNHQEFFINPKDGANTQQIEAFWNRLRFRMVRQMRHFTESELPKYMSFYWFLSLHYNPIKGSYPPDLLEIYLRKLSQIYIH